MTGEGNAVNDLRLRIALTREISEWEVFLDTDGELSIRHRGDRSERDITDAVLALPEVVELRERAAAADRVRELTFASDDGSEYEHDHGILDGHPECPACWVEDIRAALDGGQP